jgi:hypothetical protein
MDFCVTAALLNACMCSYVLIQQHSWYLRMWNIKAELPSCVSTLNSSRKRTKRRSKNRLKNFPQEDETIHVLCQP